MVPGKLVIEVVQGRDLVIKDRGYGRSNQSDPFCKVGVDGAFVGKTAVVERNLNPIWDWRVDVDVGAEARKRVTIRCFDKDTFSTDDPMGEVKIDVGEALRTGGFDTVGFSTSAGTRVARWAPRPKSGCHWVSGSRTAALTSSC